MTVERARRELRDALKLVKEALRSPLLPLVVLLVIGLVTLHLFAISMPGAFDDPDRLQLNSDGGISELVEYALLSTSAAMLLLAGIFARRAVFVPLALLIAYLALDDALTIHEHMGSLIWYDHSRGGEVIFALALGACLAVVLLLTHARATGEERAGHLALWLMIAVIAFFAVFVDALHTMAIKVFEWLDSPLLILEDGGELAGMALLFLVSRKVLADASPRLGSHYPARR